MCIFLSMKFNPNSIYAMYEYFILNYPLSDYIPAPYFPQTGAATGVSKVENELSHSRSHSSVK